jgi:hypothetical protein
MSTSPSPDADRNGKSRLLKFSKVGLAAALLLIAVGVGAVVYVNVMDGDLFTVERKPQPRRFSRDLNFSADEEVMYTLSHIGGPGAGEQINKIVAANDKQFIPVFIEMLHAAETQPIVLRVAAHRHIFALRKLSDDPRQNVQSMDSLSRQWQTWYAASQVGAPDGFAAWKGKLYGRFDDRFEDFFKNEFKPRIRPAEIVYGGVKVDDIPSLDRPAMLRAEQADYMAPNEPVFGIDVNGDARAYPQRILEWHEIVNDEIGGVAITLTYCPLSSAGIAYEGTASDGKKYTFGTSGLVYRSNKLMYDHETETLWNQLTGTPAMGKLSETDLVLKPVPIVISTWQAWRAAHPQTTVLDLNTGFKRRYEPAAAYGDYSSNGRIMFAIAPFKDDLPPKVHVFGIDDDKVDKAFPVLTVAERKVVNDSVGHKPIVLIAAEGTVAVKGEVRRRGETQTVVYDAGGPVRAFARGEFTFAPGPDPQSLLDADGKQWKVSEAALTGPNGQTLKRINGFQSYWFAWSQFHPDSVVFH